MIQQSLLALCSEVYQRVKPEVVSDDHDQVQGISPGQDHVFTFHDRLDREQQKVLDEQFHQIDVGEVEEAFRFAMERIESYEHLNTTTIQAPKVLNWSSKKRPFLEPGSSVTRLADVREKERAHWRAMALRLYSECRIAIVILAGGVNCELGEGVPTCVLDLGLLSHKSIFQLYLERVRRVQHLAFRHSGEDTHIPLYIMCNEDNHDTIADFLHENAYFGCRPRDILFFKQSNVPIFSPKGKLLLSDMHKIATCPNGSGGVFSALVGQGMIADMKSRGVKSIYMCSVDNLLAKVGDPLFMGYCMHCEVQAGLKCVERMQPHEGLGIFSAYVTSEAKDTDGDGMIDTVERKVKPMLFENRELPADLRRRRKKESGSSDHRPLELHCGNLSQYCFSIELAFKAANYKTWHMESIATPYVDLSSGKLVQPLPGDPPAGRRIAMLATDAFECCSRVAGLEVSRLELALVKHISGPDSPYMALRTLSQLHQQWITDAGGCFTRDRVAHDRDDAKCEISPLVSYDGECLEGQFPDTLQLPYYMPSQQEIMQFSAGSSVYTRRPSWHYVDWHSDFSQHVLEVEVGGELSHARTLMTDNKLLAYNGERAEQQEQLPPTPRDEIVYDRRKRDR